MKTLILTAINDDDEFYFNHLIPFLLSLKNTNYVGDIGVIAYHLSEIKKQALLKNNILVFKTENKTPTIYTLGKWYTINLKPNEECILVSYDIDTSAQIMWILDGITLCE